MKNSGFPTAGTQTRVSPEDLQPHPKNRDLYTKRDNDDLCDRIEQHGFDDHQRLVVCPDGTVLSGHRRWDVALSLKLDTVPVEVVDVDPDSDEALRILLASNDYREKTPAEKVNEAEMWLEVEKEEGKKRMAEGSENSKNHDSWKEAAEKAGFSENSFSKGKKVKEKAEEGDPDAQREWDKLETGETSIHRARKNLEKAEAEKEVEEQQDTDTTDVIVHECDAVPYMNTIGQVDLLFTDPPYSTDIDDIVSFAREWVPVALDCVRSTGFAFICIGEYPDDIQAYLNVIEHSTDWDVSQILVWTYRNTLGATPADRYKLNWQAILFLRGDSATDLDAPKTSEQWAVQDINAPDGRFGDRHHKWEKPEKLANRFIRHTTDESDVVLDPFAGTGTIALEAAELGREVRACDKSPGMLEIAEERGCQIQYD